MSLRAYSSRALEQLVRVRPSTLWVGRGAEHVHGCIVHDRAREDGEKDSETLHIISVRVIICTCKPSQLMAT